MTSQIATPPRRGRVQRASARRPGPLARVAADPRAAWAVALVLAVALGVVSVLLAPLAIAERDRGQVREVAGTLAARLTTFSADDLDAWAEGLAPLVTPRYAEEVDGLLDEAVRERMASAGVVSRGRVSGVYVQDLDRSEATVFAVVRQTTGEAGSDGSADFTVRMTMTLRRTSGGWLVDGVSVLADPGQLVPLDPGR